MRLYSGSSKDFIRDVVQNKIVDILTSAFIYENNYRPGNSEINSWRNSLRMMCIVFQDLQLSDQGVILEYQLPLTSKRLDCMICGRDKSGSDSSVIIELKQWEKCDSVSSEKVLTYTGQGMREVLHPSVQVGSYKEFLEDNHTAFYGENAIKLDACSFLHNYHSSDNDPIFSEIYKSFYEKYPLFLENDVEGLKKFILEKIINGYGMPILKRVEESEYKPSKKLLKYVSDVIKNNSRYILLDDQLLAFERILKQVEEYENDNKKGVIIINGGPGTGKSVIAINVMAELLKRGKNVHYATGSKTFTTTLRKIIGTRGSFQFKYFNSYINASENMIDVLLADESHRIRTTSNSRYTRRENRSNLPQIEELIKTAKVPVFFIDDRQNVRSGEIGSSSYIKENARRLGCEIFEYNLQIQFRCQGSDKFVQWVEQTLNVKKTTQALWNSKNEFEFKIASSPHELYKWIKNKNEEEPNSARLVAGFCWPWSDPNLDGTLVDDVVIDDFKMPWEWKDETRTSPTIPHASLWPYDPRGVNQIGSIYTIQGFEFDYVGVIIGKDLVYNFESNQWEAHLENSYDKSAKQAKEKFIDLAKNAYRILLSRAMKGCYVYFVDKETEKFFRSRMES